MRDLVTPSVPTPLVTVATNGYATPDILRNWVNRGLFQTPLPEAAAGKPRMFPLVAVYEAAMLAWATHTEFSMTAINAAWSWRKRQIAGAGFVDANFMEQVGLAPDFRPRGEAPDFFWIAKPFGWKPGEIGVDGLLVGTRADLPGIISAFNQGGHWGGLLILNVTEFVSEVDKRLAAAGWSQ